MAAAGLTPQQQTNVASGVPTISMTGLTTPATPLNVAPPVQAPIPTLIPPAPITPTTPPKPTTQFMGELDRLTSQLAGKASDASATTSQATAPFEQQLNQVNTQIAERFAQSIANQERVLASGGDTSFQSGESQRIARTDAIETLKLQAIQAGLQGNIALAEKRAQASIDTKYGQIEQDIQTAKTNIQNNFDSFTKEEKKRAQATLLRLDKDDAFVKEQKANEATIFQIASTVQKNGGDATGILEASTPEEALRIAGTKLQDPKLKYEIALLQADLAYKQKATSLLGEPTPAETKATAAAIKEAEASIPIMQDKITAVDVLKEHTGLNSRVGTGIQSRAPRGVLGTLGKAASIVGIPSLLFGDLPDKVTGKGQDFAGGVHKLTGGLTLDNLIAAKARGATFGALSEGELKILADSATSLNDWEIKDDSGKGTGFWNIDQKSFNRELDTIQALTRRALMQSQGTLLTPDEQALIDSLEAVGFDPTF